MMKRKLWLFGILLMGVFPLLSEVKNADKPLKGKWDFKPAKVWEIKSAGTDVFGIPANMQVSDEDYLYVYDKENKKNYIFDEEGNFLKIYGVKGQGPGEATYFCRIETHRGFLFVFVPNISRHNRQEIDIFSPEGKYFYRGSLAIEDDLTMLEPQISNPYIKDEFPYVSVMDRNDNVKIIKYKISLPEMGDIP